MKSFSKIKITILILIFLSCQFVIGSPVFQKPTKELTKQLTDEDTKHNEVKDDEEYDWINEENFDIYMTTVELSNIEMLEFQLPEVQFPEIQSTEVQSAEIQFEPILEKIREAFGFIGGLGTCFVGVCRLLGCGAAEEDEGACVIILRSLGAIGAGALKLLPLVIIVVGSTMLYLYVTGKKDDENLTI
ncbi:25160_t:CDS:2 [Dentiscutata erythropus]|uniref:25160_t:CDS:1 n=1 Tax=Dentiscutata erythropus TaxID=1348616 RepID=A0A9N9DL01_9GLOM|nr:25160_t:CDS:2 [Dentiscutata erythropus]